MPKSPADDKAGKLPSMPAPLKAKIVPRPPANKAEHAAHKRADKQVAKPWMKKR